MGFKFAAFFAGRNPKITPIATETVNATTIALTEGVTVMSNSLPAAEESKIPTTIPITPPMPANPAESSLRLRFANTNFFSTLGY